MTPGPVRRSVRALVAAALAVSAACATAATRTGGAEQYTDSARYRAARERLIAEDRASRLGAGLVLTPDEETASRRLVALKQAELDRTREYFPPAHSFLETRVKRLIDESPVFEVMRRMPKGAVLHAHGGALGDYRWLATEVSNRPDCYMYVGTGIDIPRGALRIAAAPPGDGWRLVSELRREASDAAAFDEGIFKSLTLGEEDLGAEDEWIEFSTIFRRLDGIVGHPSVNPEYWRRVIAGLIADNVQYLESRSVGVAAGLIREARGDADFDVKFIPAAGRSSSREDIAQDLATVINLRVKDPDRVMGFDLVQEEDRNNTNLYYLDELLAARRDAEARGLTLPLYLHSGETNWFENENVYDAVLLGARRIGHGLALIKHPRLMAIVKERDVAIEINPISNQLLGYVPDLRNHPAVHYIAAGIPVVLSTDDPGIMRNTLSHEFYVAFMAWGLDLRSLKQLAMNSLLYSTMNGEEKRRALDAWERRWTTFIAWLNAREPAAPEVPSAH